MSEIMKIAIGESVSFRVQTVTVDTAGKWPDYIFHADDGRKFSAPKAAIDRQLEKRLNLSLGQLAGNPITIERAPNAEDKTKSWWNLSLAGESDIQPAAPSKRLTQAAAQKPAPEEDDGYGPIDETPKTAPLIDRITALTGEPTDKQGNERARLTAAYFQLWRDVATEQTALAKNLDLPVDGTSVQAATATLWITFSQKGVQ